MREVEVFADIRCPFTHVGLRRLTEWRARTGAEFALRVRAWPLELVNAEPLAATLIAEEAEALRRQIAPDLFAGFDLDNFPMLLDSRDEPRRGRVPPGHRRR